MYGAVPVTLIAIMTCSAGDATITRASGPVDAPVARTATAIPPGAVSLVERFLRCDNPDERGALARQADEAVDGDITVAALALAAVDLWARPPELTGTLSVGASPNATKIHYRLPVSYDPRSPHPLLLCLPADGMTAEGTLDLAQATLGETVRDFIHLCPNRIAGRTFAAPRIVPGGIDALVRGVRRKFHVDTDRVVLFGFGTGGDAAWLAGLLRPDLFAGAVVVSAYPHVPYPEQVYPFLLMNLRDLPVLTVWRAATDSTSTPRRRRVAAYNRAIVRFAERVSLPIHGVEVAHDAPDALKPTASQLGAVLSRPRSPGLGTVARWFRFPSHGRTGWLAVDAFRGRVWEHDQLSIAVAPDADPDDFIARTVKKQLGYLAGAVKGQAVTITARRCRRLDILLPVEALDFSKPVTVRCNGKKRYDKLLQPSIRTMLDVARQRWEFQHPVAATLSLAIREDAEDE